VDCNFATSHSAPYKRVVYNREKWRLVTGFDPELSSDERSALRDAYDDLGRLLPYTYAVHEAVCRKSTLNFRRVHEKFVSIRRLCTGEPAPCFDIDAILKVQADMDQISYIWDNDDSVRIKWRKRADKRARRANCRKNIFDMNFINQQLMLQHSQAMFDRFEYYFPVAFNSRESEKECWYFYRAIADKRGWRVYAPCAFNKLPFLS
jgi:hypothetical protein